MKPGMKKVVTFARTPAHSPGEGKVLRLQLEILAALTAFLPLSVFSTTTQELNARLNSPRSDKDSPTPGGEGPGENFPSRSSRLEPQNHRMPPLPACGHPRLHSEWRRGTRRGVAALHGEGPGEGGRDQLFLLYLRAIRRCLERPKATTDWLARLIGAENCEKPTTLVLRD